MTLVDAISQAIAQMEGYNTAGSLAQRNNNPGNLRSWGSWPVVNGYVQFPDASTGWQALAVQVSKNVNRGLTLQEFFGGKSGVYSGYSPGTDGNHPVQYAQFVSTQVGIPVNVPINQFEASPPYPRKAPKPQTPGA